MGQLPEDIERERIIAAVRDFNSLVPTLTTFAQALTGKVGIKVKADQKTYTDGNTIYLRPPLELNLDTRHIRSVCDIRRGNELICPACQRSESLFFLLFHEMSHIIGKSLDDYSNNAMIWGQLSGAVKSNKKLYKLVQSHKGKLSSQRMSVPEIAESYHRYFRFFWLAMEDVRVEKMTGNLRPGFIRMSWYEGEKVMAGGSWKEAKDDAQLSVAALCYAQGHDLVAGFSERVAEAVAVPEVFNIVNKEMKNPVDSLMVGAELVAYFNNQGFLDLDATDEEAENNQDQQGPASIADFMELLEALSGHGHKDEDDVTGKKLVQGEDPVGDRIRKLQAEILEVVLDQAENFDDFSDEVGKLIVVDGSDPQLYHRQIPKPGLAKIQGSILRARRVFSDSKMDRKVRGLKKGKLNPRALGARAWGDDDRLFHKKLRAEGVSFEVVIGGDFSWSTAHGGRIERIKDIMYCISEILSRVGVDFSVYGHTTESPESGSAGYDQYMMKFKGVGDPWNDKAKQALLDVGPISGSLDGHNFEFYRKILQKSRANKKLLVYFTDGDIPETNHYEEEAIVRREIKIFKQQNIALLVVAVQTARRPVEAGMDCILVQSSSGMDTVLREIEKRIL